MPELYYDPYSVHARLVYVVALAAKLPVTLVSTSLATAANRAPAYLALNPTGQLPTLVDGDVVVYESNAVLHYLFAKYDGGAVYPARTDLAALGAIETAYEHIRQKPWDTVNNASFEDFVKKQFAPTLGATSTALVVECMAKLDKRFQFIEAHFFKASGHHVAAGSAGETFNLADYALGCVLAQAHAVKGFALDAAAYPKLAAFYAAIQADPHFAAVHATFYASVAEIHAQ